MGCCGVPPDRRPSMDGGTGAKGIRGGREEGIEVAWREARTERAREWEGGRESKRERGGGE